jgi:hypothetical protein
MYIISHRLTGNFLLKEDLMTSRRTLKNAIRTLRSVKPINPDHGRKPVYQGKPVA